MRKEYYPDTMDSPIRRSNLRLPCDLEAQIFFSDGKTKVGEGRLFDLGLGGALIRLEGTLQVRTAYKLMVLWKESWIDLECRLSRDAVGDPTDRGKKTYGLVFTATSSQEHRLRTVVGELQAKNDPS